MTYRAPLNMLVACLFPIGLIGAGVACDSDKKSKSGDIGADGAAANSGAAADDRHGAGTGDAGDGQTEPLDDRPSATSNSGTVDDKPPLEIGGLLTVEDAEEIAGGANFTSEPLVGEPPAPDYNARRLRPRNDDGYGVGLQVWAFQKVEPAEKRFQDLKNQYLSTNPAPEAAESMAQHAFVSTRAGIENLVFHIDSPPRIVAVSCSKKLCQGKTDLAELAEKVAERIRE